MTEGQVILAVGAMLAVALGASLLAGRLRVPGLLLFLAVGMAVGSDGTGWIDFADYEAARVVGIVALSLILFEGGLSTGFPEIRPVLATSISMAIVGTIVTALLAGLAAAWLFDLDLVEGMLVGAILSSTDGAAIFAVLRGSTLRRRLARTLEGEAGFNDPIAVLLVIGFIAWAEQPDYGLADMAGLFVRQLGIGLAAGAVIGALAVVLLRRTRLASAGLYPVASLAVAALAFGGADALHGSGFLAVYVAGLWLGTASIPAKRTIETFHIGLGWLAQVVMFLVLGLLVFPADLGMLVVEGTVLAVVVAAIARPVAVFIATVGQRHTVAERVVLGWAGLRGAVPVVLATFPVIEGVPDSETFFNIAFFVVLLSTLVQGATFEPLARVLGVTTTESALPQPLADVGAVRRLGAEVVEFPVREGDAIVGHRVRELGLPRDALLNIVVRGTEAVLPRGSTLVEAGDRLHLLVRQEAAMELRSLMTRWRTGPVGPPPRRRPPVRAAPLPATVRPWDPADGDPGRPATVHGTPVAEQLRTRRDGRRGSLAILEDGRYAITGDIAAVGNRHAMQDQARRRLRLSADDAERAWWREVIGALAAPE